MVLAIKYKVFIFKADLEEITKLTTLNVSVSSPINVNILTYTFVNGYNEMVVGDTNNQALTKQMNDQFRKNIQTLKLNYREEDVIAISGLGNILNSPGILRRFFAFFYCNKYPIYASYASFSGSGPRDFSFGFRSDQSKTTEIINKLTTYDFNNADNILCVNRNNIDALVNKSHKSNSHKKNNNNNNKKSCKACNVVKHISESSSSSSDSSSSSSSSSDSLLSDDNSKSSTVVKKGGCRACGL